MERETPHVFAVQNGNPTRWVGKAVELIWCKAYALLAVFVEGSGEGFSPQPFLKVSVRILILVQGLCWNHS